MPPYDLIRGRVPPQVASRGVIDARFFDPLVHRSNNQWRDVNIVAGATSDINLAVFDTGTAFAALIPASSRGIVKGFRLMVRKGANPLAFAEIGVVTVEVFKNGTSLVPTAVPAFLAGSDTTGGNNGVSIVVNALFDVGDRLFLRVINGNAGTAIDVTIATESWLY